MAMKIKKPTEFGDAVEAEYWRIGIANIHPVSQSCGVVLLGYLNAAARTAEKQPLARKEVSVPWSAFTNPNNPSIKAIYDWLKAQPDWAAGEDV